MYFTFKVDHEGFRLSYEIQSITSEKQFSIQINVKFIGTTLRNANRRTIECFELEGTLNII